MNKALPKDAKIVYFQGALGLHHSNERLKDFVEALNRADVTVLAQQSCPNIKVHHVLDLVRLPTSAYLGEPVLLKESA